MGCIKRSLISPGLIDGVRIPGLNGHIAIKLLLVVRLIRILAFVDKILAFHQQVADALIQNLGLRWIISCFIARIIADHCLSGHFFVDVPSVN